MASLLKDVLTDKVIRQMADDGAYQRGADYFASGQVTSLKASRDGTSVDAVVSGSKDYDVTLEVSTGKTPGLNYECDCPVGTDDCDFCKHCVAAALAWLAGPAGKAVKSTTRQDKIPTLAAAAKILLSEDKAVLVKLVTQWAKDDKRLRERIILYAARRTGPNTAIAAARAAFEKATSIRGTYLRYREVSGWASGVRRAIGLFDQLFDDGNPAPVIELCESALQTLSVASDSFDDSDGYFTELRDRLEALHLRACLEARPDPVELANRLFAWEMKRQHDIFFGAANRYREVLGPDGLQRYRDLAEVEWKKVPVRGATDSRTDFREYFGITHVMKALAEASGDIEELVAVISRDLTYAYHYLEIAKVYRGAGESGKALEWAEKGMTAFAEHPDSRLREFLADEYHRCDRHPDAMKLSWSAFMAQPFLSGFISLEAHGKQANVWPEWRERALAEIRSRIASASKKPVIEAPNRSIWYERRVDHSTLVEIFLHEGDVESAWREAKQGNCSKQLWIQLAGIREKAHPEEAAPVYLEQAKAVIAGVQNGQYDEGVELLEKAATVMKRLGTSPDFVREINALRLQYKIKRNFMKLTDQRRMWLYL